MQIELYYFLSLGKYECYKYSGRKKAIYFTMILAITIKIKSIFSPEF